MCVSLSVCVGIRKREKLLNKEEILRKIDRMCVKKRKRKCLCLSCVCVCV